MDTLLKNVISVVKQASTLMTGDFNMATKGSISNIVTSNDFVVQNFLKDKLKEILPDSGFICEEDDVYSTESDCWIIDPIDGTTNYSRGLDFCAISVALKQGEDITLGVVYLPYKNELFTAIKGQGAFLNGKTIKVSNRPFEESLLCASFCAYHKENLNVCSKIINETFTQCNDVRRFGSAASELCYIAAGRCELFFEYELSPWDYAAASLILIESGGSLMTLQGKVLEYNHNTGIIAANNDANLKRLHIIVRKYVND